MKVLDYVKLVNGFFCGFTSAGLTGYIVGISRNNIYLKLEGLLFIAVGLPVVVVTAIIWYLLEKERGEKGT